MTDLLHILPNFPLKQYTHLIPSLERSLVTTTDLLTLEAAEISKRAQIPTVDTGHLIKHILGSLQQEVNLETDISTHPQPLDRRANYQKTVKSHASTSDTLKQWSKISTLDPVLDTILGGGIPTRHITEFTGESGTGKTQLLLTLLLAGQLASPNGLSRPTLYISTEHSLPTTRLNQIIAAHPALRAKSPAPTLAQIFTLQIPDLETQEHILKYQLPVALKTQNIGLVVIDSIAANYRAEVTSAITTRGTTSAVRSRASALAARSIELAQTGSLLRELARRYNCAIVVANQVADRFSGLQHHLTAPSQQMPWNSSPLELGSQIRNQSGERQYELRYGWACHPALSLDWQQRFFTGWGNSNGTSTSWDKESTSKTPALGLVWANQISCRVALGKQALWEAESLVVSQTTGRDRVKCKSGSFLRWARVVFAPWVDETRAGTDGVEFEIWTGGVRTSGKLAIEGIDEIDS